MTQIFSFFHGVKQLSVKLNTSCKCFTWKALKKREGVCHFSSIYLKTHCKNGKVESIYLLLICVWKHYFCSEVKQSSRAVRRRDWRTDGINADCWHVHYAEFIKTTWRKCWICIYSKLKEEQIKKHWGILLKHEIL